jgi:hypothetical protein
VLGILALRSSYAWSLAHVRPDPASPAGSAFPAAVTGIVDGGTLLAGAFYSLLLAAVYLPTTLFLGRHARRLAERAAGRETEEDAVRTWLERHDLAISWRGQIARIGALLAPVLSSTAVQLLGAAGGS